jgi:glycosyltransferase involved in cell wall biosynthesis
VTPVDAVSSVPHGQASSGGATAPRRLRILLAIPSYPPVVGGAEVHVSRLAAALARRGHDVRVFTTYAPPMLPLRHWRDPSGIPVTAVGTRLRVSLRPRAYMLSLAAHLALHRPPYHVVQLFLPGLHNVTGLAVARVRGVGSAVMFGSSAEVPKLRTLRLGRLQLNAIRRWADAIVVLNDEMRRDFAALGIAQSRITWLPCSVDLEVFRPPTVSERAERRRDLDLPAGAFVVTFVGRLDPVKNLPALIRCAGAMARRRNLALCIVGDGAERAHLEEVAREAAPAGRVRFLGQRIDAEVARVLQASDAFAMVSHVEGIPCALIEAMATGLPCVVHDIRSLAQLVQHGVHGLCVPVDDAIALASALDKVADDSALRARMGAAGRERARDGYGVDLVAQRHEALYLGTMARQWPTRPQA